MSDGGNVSVEQVLTAHGAALHRFCMARTSHACDADDAVQETLLHFVRRSREERIENPEAWLVAVAARVCHRLVLRRSRFAGHEPEPLGDEEDPADSVVERAWVEKILSGLQAADRALLTSLYMRDQAPAEVAAAMGRPEGTVRWLAHRARARARDVALRLSGAGAATLAWLLARAARSAPRGSLLRARLSAVIGHPSVTSLTCGPAWLLLVAGTSGLLHDAAPVLAPAAVQPRPAVVAAAPASRSFRWGDDLLTQAAPATPGPVATAAPAPPSRPIDPPPPATAPLNNWVLPSPDPHDALIQGATASPSYGSDHTLFAWGWPTTCAACADGVIYRSGDGGHTWQVRAAVGYQGGQVLLPFDYDSTHVVFAATNNGLWRSDDDGNVFTLAVALQTDTGVAVVPAPGNDSVVVVGQQPPLRYDEHSGLLSVGPALPGISNVTEMAWAGNRLLVHGMYVSAAEEAGIAPWQPDYYLLSCLPSGTSCDVTGLPGFGFVAVSPAYDRDHTIVFVSGWWAPKVEESSDGGRTFTAVTVPAEPWNAYTRVWPILDAHGALTLALQAEWVDNGTLRVALDNVAAGSAPGPFGSSELRTMVLLGVVSLPDGTMLALIGGGDAAGKQGFRCSHDHGVTWHADC
jgi:RNA polymerase sigma-70 factor, ECF subfamily